jgi:acyl carrier protein
VLFSATPSKDEIFRHIRDALVELFELEPDKIRPEAHLYRDLDLDSIDAVDLVLKLKQLTGRKIQPENFRHVRTVEDVVGAVQHLLSGDASDGPAG